MIEFNKVSIIVSYTYNYIEYIYIFSMYIFFKQQTDKFRINGYVVYYSIMGMTGKKAASKYAKLVR